MARWRARRCAPLDIYIYIYMCVYTRLHLNLRARARAVCTLTSSDGLHVYYGSLKPPYLAILAPAQHGQHNERRRSYGHSLLIDPWGEVIAELEDGDGVLFAEIDPERVHSVRRQLPSLTHRVTLRTRKANGA